MPPKLYLVRHAQGEHNATVSCLSRVPHHARHANLTQRNYTIPDPALTAKGKSQCQELSKSFKHHETIDLVLTSPLRRTIQTAALSFGPTLSRDVQFIAVPEAQEIGDHASDTGHPPNELKKLLPKMFADGELEFDINKLDLDAVKEGWTSKVRTTVTTNGGQFLMSVDRLLGVGEISYLEACF